MNVKSKKKLALGAFVAAPIIYAAFRTATDRNKGSIAMRAVATALRMQGNSLRDVSSFTSLIEKSAPGMKAAPIPAAMRERLTVIETDEGKRRVVTLSPKSGGSQWQIVYLHGGAYVSELVKQHWDIIDRLIAATGATVTVPLYPLAPSHDHRDARKFVNGVYERIVRQTKPEHVVLIGDSAGGGLVVGTALDAKANGVPLPARLILFAPWLDLTLTDPAARSIEPRDVMLGVDALRLAGTWWAGKTDPRDPTLSPLYADLSGMPPIDIFQGTNDLLAIDSRSFVTKARFVGVPARYFEYPGAFHVFMGATFMPEANDVFRIVGDTLPANQLGG